MTGYIKVYIYIYIKIKKRCVFLICGICDVSFLEATNPVLHCVNLWVLWLSRVSRLLVLEWAGTGHCWKLPAGWISLWERCFLLGGSWAKIIKRSTVLIKFQLVVVVVKTFSCCCVICGLSDTGVRPFSRGELKFYGKGGRSWEFLKEDFTTTALRLLLLCFCPNQTQETCVACIM